MKLISSTTTKSFFVIHTEDVTNEFLVIFFTRHTKNAWFGLLSSVVDYGFAKDCKIDCPLFGNLNTSCKFCAGMQVFSYSSIITTTTPEWSTALEMMFTIVTRFTDTEHHFIKLKLPHSFSTSNKNLWLYSPAAGNRFYIADSNSLQHSRTR